MNKVEALCKYMVDNGITIEEVADALVAVEEKRGDLCQVCRHKHLDKTGSLGCWACPCGHPEGCRCAGCEQVKERLEKRLQLIANRLTNDKE